MVLHTSPAQPLDKTWEFPVDNKFAAAFIQRNGLSEASFNPRRRHHKPLCSRCAQLNLSISTSILRFKGGLAGLRTDAHACRLHRLLLQACGSAPLDKNADLEIRRSGSNLYCRGHSSPILSLCRSPCTFFSPFKTSLSLVASGVSSVLLCCSSSRSLPGTTYFLRPSC